MQEVKINNLRNAHYNVLIRATRKVLNSLNNNMSKKKRIELTDM